MKIAIVGGHLSPALAVIEILSKDTQILFIGRKYALEGDKAESLEYQKITNLNFPFESLETGRIQRMISRHTISSLLKLPFGFIQSIRILREHKPDVVVGFGGYLQIPVSLAAYLLRIPIIIHEQTMRAGLANKVIAPLAKTICISWAESAKYFPTHKTVLTGLPLRKEFFNKYISLHNRPKTIYITGGSLGAHAINSLVAGMIEKLLEKFYIIHQTGNSKEYMDFELLIELKDKLPEKLKEKYVLFKHIDPDKIAGILSNADMVISRAGINTVAELIFLKKPCILIPLPHGQANEQIENALFIQKVGLGLVLNQKGLTSETLYSQIIEFADKLDNVKSPVINAININEGAAKKIIKVIKKTGEDKIR